MFIAIVFPIADFRGLHKDSAGRLDRPRWGESDPQASFARGLGSIHTRTKSGNGFAGENYYADCNNLIKYPSQFFIKAVSDGDRSILVYPFYRRFFFDGQMSGRFELGFRMNEETINEIERLKSSARYDIVALSKQLFNSNVLLELLDERRIRGTFHEVMKDLRDGYILSSVKNRMLNVYDIATVGSSYVSVGSPFAVIRCGKNTPLADVRQKRHLVSDDDLSMFITRSGVHKQNFDVAVIPSKVGLDAETAKERFARLFYTQIRTLIFAHSFYLRQIDGGKFKGQSALEPAIEAMIDRLKELTPIEDNKRDESICRAMEQIIASADVDASRLASEIELRLKQGRLQRWGSSIFRYFDKKADKATEAAASTATTLALTGSL